MRLDGPAYSIRGKPKEPRPDINTGPGDYNVRDSCLAGPAYSMMGRPAPEALPDLPGPGQYRDPSYKAEGPSFTMPVRWVCRKYGCSAALWLQ